MTMIRVLLAATAVMSIMLLGREVARGQDCGCPYPYDCYYVQSGGYDCPGSSFCGDCVCDDYFPPLVKCVDKP